MLSCHHCLMTVSSSRHKENPYAHQIIPIFSAILHNIHSFIQFVLFVLIQVYLFSRFFFSCFNWIIMKIIIFSHCYLWELFACAVLFHLKNEKWINKKKFSLKYVIFIISFSFFVLFHLPTNAKSSQFFHKFFEVRTTVFFTIATCTYLFRPSFFCCVASYIFDFIRINCKEERRRLLLLASGFLCRLFHRKNDLFGENSLSIIEKKRKSRSRRTEQVEMSVYVRNNRESSPTKLKWRISTVMTFLSSL